MGPFRYDNPFMAIMVRIANLMLLSVYWILCCIPIITVIPASAALYHTTAKVVRGNGEGVTRDFFHTIWQECKNGVLLSLICLATAALLGYGLFMGNQLWHVSIAGIAYFAFGILLALILVPGVLYIPPTLSRFDGSVSVILRLSLYLASQHIFRTLFMLVLLGLIVFLVDFYPVLLLILPGVYADLICAGMEKIMQKYADACGFSNLLQTDDALSSGNAEETTCTELDRYLTEMVRENDNGTV